MEGAEGRERHRAFPGFLVAPLSHPRDIKVIKGDLERPEAPAKTRPVHRLPVILMMLDLTWEHDSQP